MSQTKLHKIQVRNKEVRQSQITTGANTEVLLDGMILRGVTFFKYEVKPSGIGKVTIELLGSDVDIEADLPLDIKPTKKIEKNIEPIIDNGKVTGYYSPRWTLGSYKPTKIDNIDKE